jgi:hypothetical protein
VDEAAAKEALTAAAAAGEGPHPDDDERGPHRRGPADRDVPPSAVDLRTGPGARSDGVPSEAR